MTFEESNVALKLKLREMFSRLGAKHSVRFDCIPFDKGYLFQLNGRVIVRIFVERRQKTMAVGGNFNITVADHLTTEQELKANVNELEELITANRNIEYFAQLAMLDLY